MCLRMIGGRKALVVISGLAACIIFAVVVHYQTLLDVMTTCYEQSQMVPTCDISVTMVDKWKNLNASKATPKDVIDYFYWTNRSSCRLAHDFGGKMMKNPSGLDGQKAICLDPAVAPQPGRCLIYSIGINNEWSFDDAMEQYGCEIFAFDPSMKDSPKQFNRTAKIHFYQLGLGERDYVTHNGWQMQTLDSIYRQLGHEGRVIDYLKIDAEGAEWKILPQILSSGMMEKVRQLGVEFHWYGGTDLAGYQKAVTLLQSLENGPSKMVRFDSKYNPWFKGYISSLNYSGSLGFEIAWYRIIPFN